MTAGRVLATVTAAAAVAGCIALAAGLSRSDDSAASVAAGLGLHRTASTAPAHGYPAPVVAARSGSATPTLTSASAAGTVSSPPSRSAASTAAAASTRPVTTRTVTRAATTTAPPVARTPSSKLSSKPSSKPALHPASIASSAARTTQAGTPRQGVALPLRYHTGSATRVITVTAVSRGRSTARLQAWHKAPAGGWLKSGSAVTAHIGSQGMTPTPSESASATPMGSFTLTHAFGHDADPGTRLPYFRTTPSDWWISQSGPLYNTHQRCASNCPFNQGAPNEHLYYETPYYNYAVVIDYNTRNVPGGVHQGAGSAFFLHVTDGNPTAGCVAIPQQRVINLLRWLRPSTHPRILIGVR